MSVKEEIHAQIVGALAGTEFPIETPEALLAAFPQGAETTCKADGVELKAGDAGQVLKPADFPFKSAKEVADVIVERAGL
ncbi:MAG TPA: MTH865 family protein [Methanobacterium sp.]|nr:MTH865 family protein [Methanobacterium sp.]